MGSKSYTVTAPFIDDMGSIMPFVANSTPMRTKEEDALWTVNNMIIFLI